MTSDEAISIMNVIVHMLEPQYDTDRVEEAVEMAIEALKQQPVDRVAIKEYLDSYNEVKIELSGDADCIRRSDVGLTDFEIVMCNGDYKEGLKMLLDKIEKAPSVTPQQKMGQWVYDKERDSYKCSLCTFPCHKDNLGAIPTKYCAGCGAKMSEIPTGQIVANGELYPGEFDDPLVEEGSDKECTKNI